MFEAHHLQHNITSGYIQIVSDGHHLPAFWAHPELGGPFPGLVLLHDQWGLTPHARSQARRFAAQGYYVIAPDLFNRQTATSELQAKVLIEQVGEAAISHVAAALHALQTHNKCNGKIGAIGWGLGGTLALRSAVYQEKVRAAVMFYSLPGDDATPAELRMLSAPLLAIFGADDAATPADAVEALRETLAGVEIAHEVVVYDGVGRDFFNDSHDGFDADAAEQAWKKALAFLNLHLDVKTPDDPAPGEFRPGQVY
jgi:carboxymethylenebutenolidase